MDVERQSIKLENDVSVEPIYWIESVHIAATITSMSNPNSYPYRLTNSNLFQPKAKVSNCCPDDAAICKSLEKFHTNFLFYWKTERSKVAHWFCRWLGQRLSGIKIFFWTFSGCLLLV